MTHETLPIIPCPPDAREEAMRDLVVAACRAVRVLHDLQRQAREIGVDVFASRIALVEEQMTEAKDELVRTPR